MAEQRKPLSPAAKKGGAATGIIAMLLAGLYAVEGGYVNDPADRGGATNFGVTEKVARQAGYTGHMRDFQKHCIGKTTVCADAIYIRQYIDGPGFRPMVELDPAVGRELFDTGANMGPVWPSRWLQQGIGALGGPKVTVDGKIGAGTMLAYKSLRAKRGPVATCLAMLDWLDDRQAERYLLIVQRNPSQRRFLKGWLAHRIGNVPRGECKAAA
jgi:lysozyme family protein